MRDEWKSGACGGGDRSISGGLGEGFSDGLDRGAAIRVGLEEMSGPDRDIAVSDLEVAELARGSERRCFARVDSTTLAELLA